MKKKINLNLIVTAIFTAIITMICMNVINFYLFDKQVKITKGRKLIGQKSYPLAIEKDTEI